MNEKNYKVIKSKVLSKPGDPRFIVVDKATEGILDNGRGYGYKSMRKAYLCYEWKHSGN